MNCERCGKETMIYKTSWFNIQVICLECQDKEAEHPDYEKAKAAELAAVLDGDYNFPGIGKPADL